MRYLTLFLIMTLCGTWPLQAAEHAGTARPALSMGVAAAPDGALWIAGLNRDGRLFLQSTRDDGAHWTPARVIDTGDDVIAAEGESRPALAFGPGGAVVISYTQPLAKPYTGNIRLLTSQDGGKQFTPPFTLHDDRQLITHRFASMAFDGDGALQVLWIDKRDASTKDYAGAAVYGKVSRDGGRRFGPDLKLTDHSCECCRIAMAADAQGRLHALWRQVFAGSQRDHAFAPLAQLGQGRTPMRATQDGWVLQACPHHGPGLSAASDGGWHAVWYGLRDEVAAVRYGRLTRDGRLAQAPRVLPDPGTEHADVASIGDHVAIVWRSYDGERTRLRAWLSRDGGRQFVLRELSSTDSDNDHPRLVRNGQRLQVVWRTLHGIEVHRVDP